MSTPKALSNESLVSAAQDGQLTAENLSLEVGDIIVRLPPRQCVVVAVGDERRLGDAGKTIELRIVRDPPGGDCRELRVASGPR